ncbi:hypothetical protein OCT59_009315 [Rhizophagus irregularis]|nr:hypothetical protein OCT59_009315 [Rhizophagus irregularis]
MSKLKVKKYYTTEELNFDI